MAKRVALACCRVGGRVSLLPSWAPNLHPLLVHFPVALIVTAAAADVAAVFFPRSGRLHFAASSAYTVGAIAAVVTYWTGLDAAATVRIPGMAHGLVDDHRMWALVTTWYLVAMVAARLLSELAGVGRVLRYQVLFVVLGIAGMVLVQQTAERGARLVYEHGVGVIRTEAGARSYLARPR